MTKVLVTGANGHLGNNIVRELLKQGRTVRAMVRNPENRRPFQGLDVEVVYGDLLKPVSLDAAMAGVDVVYQAAAPVKMWSRDPEREIIWAAVEGTRALLQKSREHGIKKVIYVSSIAACGTGTKKNKPFTEKNWNENHKHPYFIAKTKSEQEAFKVSRELDIWLASVLPSAIVGPHAYTHLTPTLEFIQSILENRLPLDPQMYFNFVDVRDVAQGALLVEEKGKSGERYILANEEPMDSRRIARILHEMYPHVKIPELTPPKLILKAVGGVMKATAQFTGAPPLVTPETVDVFFRQEAHCDISKARKKLGWEPRMPETALRETALWLKRHWAGHVYIGDRSPLYPVRRKNKIKTTLLLALGGVGILTTLLLWKRLSQRDL